MKKTLWILLDDRKGSVGQARGIAEALEDRINIIEKELIYTKQSWIPNWIKGRSLIGIDEQRSSSLQPPYPDIILSTSRRTVSTARYLRKKSKNQIKIIQLMYPSGGVGIKDMEMIIVPSHDNPKKQLNPKSLVITGAPTRIFPNVVKENKLKWDVVFKDLPKPWISVIVGGAIKGKPWPLETVKDFADSLKQLHNTLGGSLLITTSRRTGKDAEKIILSNLEGVPMYTYLWGEQKKNPIMGFYACADIIVATADSVSMCTEACGTGNPVLLFRDSVWLPKKHQRFASSLIEQGYAQDIKSPEAFKFRPKKTLNSSNLIADKILEIC